MATTRYYAALYIRKDGGLPIVRKLGGSTNLKKRILAEFNAEIDHQVIILDLGRWSDSQVLMDEKVMAFEVKTLKDLK